MKRSSMWGRALSVTLSLAMVTTLNAPMTVAFAAESVGGGSGSEISSEADESTGADALDSSAEEGSGASSEAASDSSQATVDAVNALIAALPAASDVTAENAESVNAQLSEISDAIDALESDDGVDYDTLTAVADAVSAASVTAATDGVAKIGETAYTTLQAAIDAAASGDTVTLFTDATESVTIASDDNVTLDLAGHTLTGAGGHTITNNGTLVIKDSSSDGTGTVDNTTNGKGALVNLGTATLESGKLTRSVDQSGNSWYVVQNGGESNSTATFNVTGGSIIGTSSISSLVDNYGVMKVSGGTIQQSPMNIIKVETSGTLTVSGGTITRGTSGSSSVEAIQNYGTTTINDGASITGLVTTQSYSSYAGTTTITGGTITGDVYTNWQKGASTKSTLKISGGTITGTIADYYNKGSYSTAQDGAYGNIAVSGGSFSSIVNVAYCADNYMPVTTKNDAGYYTVTTGSVVAVLGYTTNYYTSVQAAIDAIANGATTKNVRLLEDVTEPVTIPAGVTMTLNLNGHKIVDSAMAQDSTVSADSRKHTITNNGTLTISGSAGSTVDNVSHGKAAVYNAAGATCTIASSAVVISRSTEASTSKDDNGKNSYYVIDNRGTMVLGSYSSYSSTYSGPTVKYSDTNTGKYSSLINNLGDENNTASLTIMGGTYTGGLNSVKNADYGTLKIEAGTFDNTNQFTIMNWSTAEISGGTFTNSEAGVGIVMNARWKNSDSYTTPGSVTISGGTFTGEKGVAGYGKAYDALAGGTVKISGGEFNVTTLADGSVSGVEVTIEDGTFNIAEGGAFKPSDSTNTTVAISGGSYSKVVPTDCCASGYAPVTTTNDDGKYTVVETTKVASVTANGETTKYETLAAAITAAGSSEATITLLADVTESVTIPSGASITLDLAGHMLTGTSDSDGKMSNVVTNNGTLTIKDSSATSGSDGTGTIMGGTDTGSGDAGRGGIALYNNAGGTVTLESGTIKRGDNGTFGNYTAVNEGTMTISGGAITNCSNTSSMVRNNGGTLTMTGGALTQNGYGNVIKNDEGTLNISGGTVSSTKAYTVQNWGVANISGGTFNNTISTWTQPGSTEGQGVINITGGSFTNIYSINYPNSKGNYSSVTPTVNISGDETSVSGYVYPCISKNGGLYLYTADKAITKVSVSGGSFAHEVQTYNCADGYEPTYATDASGMYHVQTAKSKLHGHSLTLDGSIGLNFYFQILDSDLLENGSLKEGYSVSFTATSSDGTIDVAKTAWDKSCSSDSTIKGFSVPLLSDYSTKDITVTMTISDTNGKMTQSSEANYSAYDYLTTIMNAKTSTTITSELKTLAQALATYDYYAYAQFTGGTYPGSGISLLDLTSVTADSLASYKQTTGEQGSYAVMFYGTQMQYLEENLIWVYAKLPEGMSASDVQMGYKKSGATEWTKVSVTDQGAVGGLTVVRGGTAKIPSGELGDSYNIAFFDASGNQVSPIRTMRAYSTVYSSLKSSNTSDNEKNLARALYEYGEASKKYFNTSSAS